MQAGQLSKPTPTRRAFLLRCRALSARPRSVPDTFALLTPAPHTPRRAQGASVLVSEPPCTASSRHTSRLVFRQLHARRRLRLYATCQGAEVRTVQVGSRGFLVSSFENKCACGDVEYHARRVSPQVSYRIVSYRINVCSDLTAGTYLT